MGPDTSLLIQNMFAKRQPQFKGELLVRTPEVDPAQLSRDTPWDLKFMDPQVQRSWEHEPEPPSPRSGSTQIPVSSSGPGGTGDEAYPSPYLPTYSAPSFGLPSADSVQNAKWQADLLRLLSGAEVIQPLNLTSNIGAFAPDTATRVREIHGREVPLWPTPEIKLKEVSADDVGKRY